MEDETQMILQQMRGGRSKLPVSPEEYYAKLGIHKGRRRALPFILIFCFILFAGMISTSLFLEHHWLTTLGPIMIVGGLMVLLPPTEEWIYTPWQSSSQMYERHFTE